MPRRFIGSLVLVLLIGFLGTAVGQQIAKVDVHSVDVSQFPINFVYYTTQDASGKYLGPVDESEVELYEGGVEEKVWSEEEEQHFPASLVLILDSSGSMKKAMGDVLSAARSLVDKLGVNDQTEIVDFDSKVQVVQRFTNSKKALSSVLNTISAGGGTALYDATARGIQDVKKRPGLKAIVLLTDGKDENARGDGPGSTITLGKLKGVLKSARIPVYVIGLGEGVDKPILEDIASVSGGKAYYAKETDAVSKIYSDIIVYLHSLHRFHYVSRNGQHDGTKREVSIKQKRGKSRSETFYFSPKRKYWSYAFSPDKEHYIHHLAISPDGKYIAALNVMALLSKQGIRRYVRWGGTDAFGGVCSKKFVQSRSWKELGSLSRFDGKDYAEIGSHELLSSAGGTFHKDWGWCPKALSRGDKYLIFACRPDDQKYGYYFMLYSIPEKKVIWEKGFYKGEFDEPGAIAVADNGTALITQDFNLFAVTRDGKILFSWMCEKTDKRVGALAMTDDGSKFIARLDGEMVHVYSISGKLLWKVESKAESSGGGIDVSSNGKYFAVNDQFGPRIFAPQGKVLFQNIQKKPAPSDHSENGIAIANDGSFVYALANRIYYRKIE